MGPALLAGKSGQWAVGSLRKLGEVEVRFGLNGSNNTLTERYNYPIDVVKIQPYF